MTNSILASGRSFLSRLQLRRIITSNRFIPEVDGFRFLAIVIVITAHIYGQCGPIPGNGFLVKALHDAVGDGKRGVYLFFTISGFILALPFARHHLQQGNAVDLRSYFRRRITRLEPPYVLAMFLRLPVIFFYKQLALSSLLLHFFASLFYVHNIIFNQSSIINPPAWSLEVEIQFYLLAPLLSCLFLIRNKHLRRFTLLAIILWAGIAAPAFISPVGRLSLTLLCYLQYFFAGFLLCDFYLANDGHFVPAWLWDVIGVSSVVWILCSHAAWYPVALPFATIALYMAGFNGRAVRAFFSFRPVSLIGGMCYSLYLTHSTVLTALHPLATRLTHTSLVASAQGVMIFGLCFASIFFVGLIYFVLIERPCMDPSWPHKLAVKLRRTQVQISR
jgi:peptidoglycan/LPS O-acetylase OafA/YrhL